MITTSPGIEDLARFRALVERRMGLRFPDDAGADLLAKALQARLAAIGAPACSRYLDELDSGHPAELEALATLLTIGETYFMRHLEQFQALSEKVVPERLRLPGRSGPLRVLSAGCASGEETYSLAIALHEIARPFGSSILGIDINPEALRRARQADYTTWSLRSVPEAVARRWFTVEGDQVRLDPRIRDQVRFQQSNLAADDPGIWRPDSFDVIFCRNVLMYFAPEVMAQAVRRLARALVPGGYLFLGSAETLRGVSTDFTLCESHGAFYYRHDQPGGRLSLQPRPLRRPAAQPASVPIGPASVPTGPASELIGPASVPGVEVTLNLLREERFAQALTAIEQVISTRGGTPGGDLMLLRAALLTHGGSYPAAVEAAQRLLQQNGTRTDLAGAHVLLATCREFESDVAGAIEHCRTAIRYDPGFAMAHVQLARLSGRIGRAQTASQEYATSVLLLATETDRRILLFGGGFDRDALISLCRTQSAGNGGDR